MARHPNRAQVYSVNGRRLRSIGKQEALDIVDSGQALRLSRLKADELVIMLTARKASYRPTASITFNEMKAIAGECGPRVRGETLLRLGNFVDEAMTKLELWPVIGDNLAPRMFRRAALTA